MKQKQYTVLASGIDENPGMAWASIDHMCTPKLNQELLAILDWLGTESMIVIEGLRQTSANLLYCTCKAINNSVAHINTT